MAPQDKIPTAANVLGTIGTVFGVFKIWTNWRSKKTDGLPAAMMFLWAVCGVPFGTYNIVQNFNIPLQVQSQIFMFFCLCSFTQVLYYGHKWPALKAACLGISLAGTFAGVEAALILTLRPIYRRGNEAPMLVIGILASVLMAIGLLPPYIELWKRHGRVIGINWIFLTIDCLGAFFSAMALAAQNSFDVLGGVLYIICILLELGIFTSQGIFLLRTRSMRKKAKAEGKTFDDLLEEHRAANLPFAFAEREPPVKLTPSYWFRRVWAKKPAEPSVVADEEKQQHSDGYVDRAGVDSDMGGVTEEKRSATEADLTASI